VRMVEGGIIGAGGAGLVKVMRNSGMRILLLDYSHDGGATAMMRQWMPEGIEVESFYIDSEQSFPEDAGARDLTHVIHSGSILSINEVRPFTAGALNCIRRFRDRGVRQMGICYGHQLINLALVGERSVGSSARGFEAGWCEVFFHDDRLQIPGISRTETLWQHHFDEVVELPAGSVIFATNEHTSIQGFVNADQLVLGTQFHPEFNRDQGNEYFLKDRKLLAKHDYNVDEIIQTGPSVDTGRIFFDFFLNHFGITAGK
jgi:GMP synthase-like glutamine amidotransferase